MLRQAMVMPDTQFAIEIFHHENTGHAGVRHCQ